MAKKFYDMNPTEFAVWLETFIEAATANAAEAGMKTGELTNLKTMKGELDDFIKAENDAQQAASAANVKMHSKHRTILEKIRSYNTTFKNDKNISDEVKVALGFNLDDEVPSTLEPQAPQNLFAQGFSNGVNSLSWKRSGNNERTQFIVEAKIGAATDFTMVGSTTRTRFDHEGQTPGAQAIYRVYAQRGKLKSQPSNEAIVYQQ